MLAVGALPPASLLLRTSLVLLLIGALLFTCLGGVVPSRKLDLDNWAAWIWTRLFDYEAASATAAAVTPPLATSIVGYCVSVTSVEMMPMAIQLALTLRSFGSVRSCPLAIVLLCTDPGDERPLSSKCTRPHQKTRHASFCARCVGRCRAMTPT